MNEISNNLGNFKALYNFTRTVVAHAREEARQGNKDNSRDWLRFIRNARILPILSASDCELFMDLKQLQSDLRDLESEVHPQAHCDNRNDLQKIRENLEIIAKHIFEKQVLPASEPTAIAATGSTETRSHTFDAGLDLPVVVRLTDVVSIPQSGEGSYSLEPATTGLQYAVRGGRSGQPSSGWDSRMWPRTALQF